MSDPLSALLSAAAKQTDDEQVRAWLLALAGSEATYASSDGTNPPHQLLPKVNSRRQAVEEGRNDASSL